MQRDDTTAPSRTDLKEATLRGARSLTLVRAMAQALRLGSSIVIAHFVAPAEFGRAAIALIVCTIAQAVAAQGIATPLVQRERISRADVASAVLVSLACGAALAALTYAVSPLALTPLFGAETVTLMQIASIMFVLTAFSVVSQALLQRRLDFRRISQIEALSELALAGVSVGLAVDGFGATAIILGSLAAATTVTILSLLTAPVPWPRRHRGAARELSAFGGPAALAGLINLCYRNVDYAILGATLPAAAVGYYFRAFSLGVDYQQKISSIAVRVAFPVYSRARDISDMRTLRARLGRAQATLVFPILALFIALAPVVVPAVFGARWRPAAVPTQILAFGGMFALLRMTTAPFMLALGRPRTLLGFNVFAVAFYGAAVLAASRFGLVAVCAAVVAAQAVLLAASFSLLVRLAGVSLGQLWEETLGGTVGACALLVVAWPLGTALHDAGLGPFAVIAAASSVGLAAYSLAVRQLAPAAWADVRLVLARVLPSPHAFVLVRSSRRPRPTTATDPGA